MSGDLWKYSDQYEFRDFILENESDQQKEAVMSNVEDRLKSLERIYKDGLISKDEYDKTRRTILDQF